MDHQLIQNGNIYGKLMTIRQQPVLIDRDVAAIYGVQTKVINQAVKRNEDKFPTSYRFPLEKAELQQLVTICGRFKTLKHTVKRKRMAEGKDILEDGDGWESFGEDGCGTIGGTNDE